MNLKVFIDTLWRDDISDGKDQRLPLINSVYRSCIPKHGTSGLNNGNVTDLLYLLKLKILTMIWQSEPGYSKFMRESPLCWSFTKKVVKQLMNRIHFPLEEAYDWLCDLNWVEYVIRRCDHCDSEVLCPCCSWVWTVAVLGPCLAVWLRLFWSVWSVLPSTLQLSFLACTGQDTEIMLVSVLANCIQQSWNSSYVLALSIFYYSYL